MAKAVTRPDGSQVSFRCDQNGNVLTGSGAGADYPWRSVQYDASNRPVAITSGAYTVGFAYDSNGQRAFEHLRQVDGSNNVLAQTVIRRGPRGFEGESTSINVPGSNRTLRHELGDAIVILRTTDSAGGTLNDGRNVEVYYRHTDRLGSPLALSDSARAFRQAGAGATTRRAFDAFGQTRNADFSDRTQPPQVGSLGLAPATRNGFTGHEHLDTLGLIHMNGRVYDYRLGRFLSVDPIIQNPAHSQSLNPYSYIGNNPFSGADPSGYAECVVTEGHSCTAMNNDSRSADKLGHTQLSMGSDGKITAHGSDGSTVRDLLGKGERGNGAVGMSSQGAGGAKNAQAQPSDQMKQSNAPSGNSSSNFVAVNVITPTANERADEIVRKDADTFAGLFLGPLKAWADIAIGARDHDSARMADGAAWSMINALPGGEVVQTLRSARALRSVDELFAAASKPFNGSGLSVAARAWEKHAGRAGGTFEQLTGGVMQKNVAASNFVLEVLTNPASVRTELSRGGLEFRLPSGKGARFDADGAFSTFLDPKR